MARIRSMLGTIEGSAGGLTFASRGGINVLRQKVGRNSSNTPAQQAQRSKFGELGRLAQKLGGILPLGYKTIGGQSGYNRFMAVNSPATSLDSNQAPVIDLGMIEVSAGNVTPLVGLGLTALATGQTVTWTDNSNGTGALSTDKVYVAIVKKATGEVATALGTSKRDDGTIDVAAPFLIGAAAADLAVYAFARRAAGNEASNTTRLGSGYSTPVVTYSVNLAGPSDSQAGVTLTAMAGDYFRFNQLTSGTSAPANMSITLSGTQVASVDYLDRYNGQPFKFEHNGVSYTRTFASGTVAL